MDFIFMLSNSINSWPNFLKKIFLLLLIWIVLYIHNHILLWFALLLSWWFVLNKYREKDSFFIQDVNSIFYLSDSVPFFYQLISTVIYLYIRILVVIWTLVSFSMCLYHFHINLILSIIILPFSFLLLYLASQYLLRFLLNLKQGEKIFLKIIDLDKKLKWIVFYEDF